MAGRSRMPLPAYSGAVCLGGIPAEKLPLLESEFAALNPPSEWKSYFVCAGRYHRASDERERAEYRGVHSMGGGQGGSTDLIAIGMIVGARDPSCAREAGFRLRRLFERVVCAAIPEAPPRRDRGVPPAAVGVIDYRKRRASDV